jgi:hypothetical protein
VSCPGGQTTAEFREDGTGTRIFQFGARCADCPLRAQCTAAAQGRTLQVHAQEALLQEARAFQASPAGREKLRERVIVEHGLARMAQRGVGQARYCGRVKTRFQMVIVAAVVNLRLVWNRTGAGTAPGGAGGARGPAAPGFWARIGRWLHPGGGNRLSRPRWKSLKEQRWLYGCGAGAC